MSDIKVNSGIGFTGFLTILFVGLKLTKVIDWSWVWVLSPIWIKISIILLVLLVIFIIKVLL